MSTVGQAAGGLVGGIAGFLIGGPSGAIYGAQIGIMAGGYLDPPKVKGNHPQVDLSVQTATYGAPIGTGYGNYATYGNVFWVEGNSLRMSEGNAGGGKGGAPSAGSPDEVYSTFAIGFGEGEIAAFGRIWCNGNLVYDPTAGTLGAKMANGDVAGYMTFYLGGATQLPDDRIQADMGVAHAPGYRGLHYIVFKDWPMADYGNTLMGLQVKAEILRSVTVAQYERRLYADEVIPDTNDFPGASSTEYGYFNPRVVNGVFYCEKASSANSYAYTFAISHEGKLIQQTAGSYTTGSFGYIGAVEAGVVEYAGSTTGAFTVGGAAFKTKTADSNNTCHGMAVGADGRIYALERVAGAWLFNIYDGSTLSLISSGVNNPIRLGDNTISNPCIPGTNVSFCVENDGIHVWTAQEGGSDSNFQSCSIDASGNLVSDHWFDKSTDSHLGPYARFAAIYAINGVCYGVNNHGGFFIFDRNKTLTATSVPLADIIEARCLLSGLLDISDLDTSAITQMVRGYKVREVAAIRASLEPLQGAFPFDIVPSGYQLEFKPRGASSTATIDISELGCVAGNEKVGDILTQTREMDSQLPVKVQVTYIDVNREYDKGTGPGSWRLNTNAVNVLNLDMPIVLNADEAAGIEEVLLYMYWMERTEFRFVLPPTRLYLEPSDVITLTAPGASYELRLTEINVLTDGRMECVAKPNDQTVYTPTAQGQEGLVTGQVLTWPGATLIGLLDLPCVDSTFMNTPGFVAAIDGYSPDWTGGTLFGSANNGATWSVLESLTAPGSMIGRLVTPPSTGRTDSIDTANQFTARFFSPANLASLTWPALYAGDNHFAIGANGRWEIVGAKTAAQNADETWAFSDLLRGRFGTEHNMSTHATGDYIVLLDPSRLEFINLSSSSIGLSGLYAGATLKQALDTTTSESFAYGGENLECRAPISIKGAKDSSGDWGVEWTRRTRLPVEPFSGMPAPLGESSESYEVEIWDSTWTTLKRTITGLSSAAATYTNTQQMTDFGAVQKLIYVRVYQLSATVGRGYAGQSVCGNLALLNVKSLMHFDDAPASSGRVLGLHCDGTNGSTTFTDVTGKTVTAAGNAQISTAQYPSLTGKTSSALFDGADDYLSVPDSADWDFGTGDFTVRMRVRFASVSSVMTLIGNYQDSTTGWALQYRNDTGTIRFGNGNPALLDVSWSPSINTWYDLEVSRAGTSMRAFVDGTQVGSTVTNSTNISGSAGSFLIGALYFGSYIQGFSGYLSEIEVFKGIALHTGNFTPSGFPFSAASQSIIDSAQNEVTVVGTAVTVSESSAFGGICLQAYQSDGYLTTPVIPLTEDYWTIDLWIKPDALPTGGTSGIIQYGTASSGPGGFCLALNTTGQILFIPEHGIDVVAGTVSASERAHVFIQRAGDTIYVGAKGSVGGSRAVSQTTFVGDKSFRIGYALMAFPDPKSIKIDEFRVFAGEAKYPLSGNYVVPTTPFPDL